MPEYEIEAVMPRLVIPSPHCGNCGQEVEYDSGVMWCDGCRVQWNHIEDGALSVPDPDREGADVPCAITPSSIDSGTGWSLVHGPCILPSGHDGEHECPMSRVPHSSVPVQAGAVSLDSTARQSSGLDHMDRSER